MPPPWWSVSALLWFGSSPQGRLGGSPAMTSGSFLKGLVQIWWCLKEEENFSSSLVMIPGSSALTTPWCRCDYTSIIVFQQCNACIMFRWEQKLQLQRGGGVSWCHWVKILCVITLQCHYSFMYIVPCTGCKNIPKVPLALYEWMMTANVYRTELILYRVM